MKAIDFHSLKTLSKYSIDFSKKKLDNKPQNFYTGIDCISIGRMKEQTLGSILSETPTHFYMPNEWPMLTMALWKMAKIDLLHTELMLKCNAPFK